MLRVARPGAAPHPPFPTTFDLVLMRPLLPLALALLAAPARAQFAAAPAADPAPDSAAPPAGTAVVVVAAATAPAPVSGAPVADAAVGLRPVRGAASEPAGAVYQPPRRRGYGRSVALMATGGAAVVLGALAGGDAGGVLILGGAVVGLIGLYDYLR